MCASIWNCLKKGHETEKSRRNVSAKSVTRQKNAAVAQAKNFFGVFVPPARRICFPAQPEPIKGFLPGAKAAFFCIETIIFDGKDSGFFLFRVQREPYNSKSTTVASVARIKSSGFILICTPRWPPLMQTLSYRMMVSSINVRNFRFMPSGVQPPRM